MIMSMASGAQRMGLGYLACGLSSQNLSFFPFKASTLQSHSQACGEDRRAHAVPVCHEMCSIKAATGM